MKTFSTHLVRNVLAFVVVTSIAYGMYLSSPSTFDVSKVEAGAGQNVSGWAWSEGTGSGPADNPAGPYAAGSNPGVGWISFNSSDCDTDKNGKTDTGACGGDNSTTVATDYGVNVNPVASTGLGAFSGNAWSPNDPDALGNPTGIGWISFNRTTTGAPLLAWGDPGLAQVGTPLAYIDWTTGKVYGWARAIVACKNTNWNGTNCTNNTAGDTAGGWDGWISLSGTGYGVVVAADGSFSGRGWGGDVVGWVNFAPGTAGINKVHLPIPCTATTPGNIWSNVCTASCVGNPSPRTITGVEAGVCADGTSITRSCTVSKVCTAAPGSPVCGDTICNALDGETFGTCPADCKIKTKFQQF